MTMNGVYLYAVIDSSADSELGSPGLDGKGLVSVIAGRGLGCVVSHYEGAPFEAQPKEVILRNLLAHQRVVEQAMKGHTVLPVKFGTLLSDPREVEAFLSSHCSLLAQALESIRDKVEVEMAATWDTGRVLQELSTEKEIASAREAMASREPTVADRVRLGQMVKGYMDRRRKAYQERMISLLSPVAVDVAFNALVSDEMVMNVAFLLEKSSCSLFEDKLSALDRAFRNEIDFRVIGPLPPYSFSTLAVVKLRWQEIRHAMDMLGLQRIESEAEVRRAYRRLAAEEQHGPDTAVHTGVPPDDLKRASDLLLKCLGARDAHHEEPGSCRTLNIDAVEDMLMVATTARSQEDIEPARFGAALEV